jgi:hypothetical protein
LDAETRALYNAVVAGKITRDRDKRDIQIAALIEAIAEMQLAMKTGEAAISNAEDLIAKLRAA